MRADDELHPYLFLFIHITGKLFHIALTHLIVERSIAPSAGDEIQARSPFSSSCSGQHSSLEGTQQELIWAIPSLAQISPRILLAALLRSPHMRSLIL